MDSETNSNTKMDSETDSNTKMDSETDSETKMEETTLSPEQRIAINIFNKGENIFLTGQGGTGKSFLIKQFINNAKLGKTINVTAMTGTAAILLNCGATTIHRWSGIRIARGTIEEVISNTYKNYGAKKNWKKTDILIIDEVSMMSQKIFEILEELGRIIRKNPLPFGGIQIILCGDFFQLPPVPNHDEPMTERFCFQSPIWNQVFKKENHIELTTVFRQTDPIYKSILAKIRIGNIDEEALNILKERLHITPPPELKITKLFPILQLVKIENQKQFDLIDGDIYEYEYNINTRSRLYHDNGTEIPRDVVSECNRSLELYPDIAKREIASLLESSKSCDKLHLKIGAFVMTTVNLNLENGICNGSQGIIVAMNTINGIPTPSVQFYNGVIMDIPPYTWQSDNFPVITIQQIPLVLAWAMSIHKSQGATLKYAQMDIGNSIFAEGQVYVALSRLQSIDGLFLNAINPDKIKVNPDVVDFYTQFLWDEHEHEHEHKRVVFEDNKTATITINDQKIAINDQKIAINNNKTAKNAKNAKKI